MMVKIDDVEDDLGSQVAPLGIIALQSANELGEKVNKHLLEIYPKDKRFGESGNFLIEAECPRFTTGEAKGLIKNSVRGNDLYLIVDVGNYNCSFEMFGQRVPMTPDDHFADLKRIISAVGGKAHRINVIMPMLYGGRQHKRMARESLDGAVMLRELEGMGVENIITFDAHDARVQNATPLMGFDNVIPTYQVLKALLNKVKDLRIDKEHMMIVSPDEGAMYRNMYYSSVLGIDLGMFYKRRDYSIIKDGRNPIVAHEYLGNSVENKDIFISDDLIATGDSIMDVAKELKQRKAKRIFVYATYGLFTTGLDAFNYAYHQGIISGVLSTNLTYQSNELKSAPWYINVDVSKYLAYIITALNNNRSISQLLDPHTKISNLLKNY